MTNVRPLSRINQIGAFCQPTGGLAGRGCDTVFQENVAIV